MRRLCALVLSAAAGLAHATDTYVPATGQLSIPMLGVGGATLSDVVVAIGAVLGAPHGTAATGLPDLYDPASRELAVPAVRVGAATYYNAIASVAGLISAGGVTGADTFDGQYLTIPQVQVGATAYGNVVITIGRIVSPGGGMPGHVRDVYDSASGQLTIAAIQVGATVYTNAVVTVGRVVSIGGALPLEATLHAFSGNGGVLASQDGAQPSAALVQGSDGNFYGTTPAGGAYGQGSVFRLTSAGTLTVMYSFSGHGGAAGSTDGAAPAGALVEGRDGALYGTTSQGGANSLGTVFRITTAGAETVLHSFGSGPAGSGDGAVPFAGLDLGRDGNFYGTTAYGGLYSSGTVFRFTPSATLPVAYAVLYSFSGNSGLLSSADGAFPTASLVQGADGRFYGTTSVGGIGDAGTVFAITAGGAETPLYSFGLMSTDGSGPAAALVAGTDGAFYGTTALGGAYGSGTVFRITPAGTLTTLYAFSGGGGLPGSADGSQPNASLVRGSDGNFYGTTSAGGDYGAGSVFRITTGGIETPLYSFSGGTLPGSVDAAAPQGALIRATDGNFYGTAAAGGTFGQGAIFTLSGLDAGP